MNFINRFIEQLFCKHEWELMNKDWRPWSNMKCAFCDKEKVTFHG